MVQYRPLYVMTTDTTHYDDLPIGDVIMLYLYARIACT